MKISPHPQGSVEWLQARAGIPTASEFDQLITPEGKIRTGAMPKSYLAKKISEWWSGGAIMDFSSFAMEQGTILEDEAIPWYELEFSTTVARVGLITTDDGTVGCSPDGMLDGMGLECKCPQPQKHVAYLLAEELPKDYVAQVQGGIFVTGLPHWRFLSYCRNYPELVLTVERDEKFQSALGEALDMFLESFGQAQRLMISKNGGPPKRFAMKPAPDTTCEQCGGVGFYPRFDGDGRETHQEQCEFCYGTGRVKKPAPAPLPDNGDFTP